VAVIRNLGRAVIRSWRCSRLWRGTKKSTIAARRGHLRYASFQCLQYQQTGRCHDEKYGEQDSNANESHPSFPSLGTIVLIERRFEWVHILSTNVGESPRSSLRSETFRICRESTPRFATVCVEVESREICRIDPLFFQHLHLNLLGTEFFNDGVAAVGPAGQVDFAAAVAAEREQPMLSGDAIERL
jgi:hypothetical protein